MADKSKQKNGSSGQPDPAPAPAVLKIVGQYLKDLSFENPNVEKRIDTEIEPPQLKLAINVSAHRVRETIYESSIQLQAEAATVGGMIYYELELVFGGLFQIENVPEAALESILLINAPAVLFPFVRRLALDLTREGGFPPLQIDPVDFAALFLQRQQELAAKPPGAGVN